MAKKKKYEIHIYVMGERTDTILCKDKAEAKKQYYHHASCLNKYTQLIVDGVALNTAKAECLLGPQKPHDIKYKGRYSVIKWKSLKDSDIPISHMCCDVMKKNPAKEY